MANGKGHFEGPSAAKGFGWQGPFHDKGEGHFEGKDPSMVNVLRWHFESKGKVSSKL
jgi:hypothetical protein